MMERVGDRWEKNGRIFFDRPKPTMGCSASGRGRRRRRRRKEEEEEEEKKKKKKKKKKILSESLF
jgi:hypothetical protein